MERAADRAQDAAVSHYLSSLTDVFCSSLPTDSGKTDRFVMRPRSLVGGRNTSDLVTVTVTVTVTKETEAKYTGRMLACFQQPGGLNKKPDCLRLTRCRLSKYAYPAAFSNRFIYNCVTRSVSLTRCALVDGTTLRAWHEIGPWHGMQHNVGYLCRVAHRPRSHGTRCRSQQSIGQ